MITPASKFAILLFFVACIVACGGGFSSSDEDIEVTGTGDGNGYSDIEVTGTGDGKGKLRHFGTALLGPDRGFLPADTINLSEMGHLPYSPFINAKVFLYAFDNLATIICESTTSSAEILGEAGRFEFDDDCPVESQALYVVEVSDGEYIGLDEDAALSGKSFSAQGSIRALISGDRLLERPWYVTALTEEIFVTLQFMLNFSTSEQIIMALDNAAPLFLKDDINEDGVIDADDLLAWNPEKHLNSIFSIDALVENSFQVKYMAFEEETFSHEFILSSEFPHKLSNEFVAHLDTGHVARQVVVDGQYAYVAAGSTLQIIDVADPLSPTIVAKVPTGRIFDIAINGDFAYVALGNAGILKIDISDRKSPDIVSKTDWSRVQVATSGSGVNSSVWVTGQVAWSGTQEVRLLDSPTGSFLSLEQLSVPTPNRYTQTASAWPAVPTLFKIVNNLAFVGMQAIDRPYLHIIDINKITEMPGSEFKGLLSTIEFPPGFDPVLDVEVINDVAYFAIGHLKFPKGLIQSDMFSFDISDATSPRRLEYVPTPLRSVHRCASGLVCAWKANDIQSDKLLTYTEDFKLLGSTELPRFSLDLSVTALAAFSEFGQLVYNVLGTSDCDVDFVCMLEALQNAQYNPILNSQVHGILARLIDSYSKRLRFAVSGEYAYFALGQYGLMIYKIPGIPAD